MTKKITKLTPEQEADLPRFRQRYLDMACNGSRIDRPTLESAMADAYALLGRGLMTALRLVSAPTVEDELRSLLLSLERVRQTEREIQAAMLPLRQRYAAERGEYMPPAIERLKRELLG